MTRVQPSVRPDIESPATPWRTPRRSIAVRVAAAVAPLLAPAGAAIADPQVTVDPDQYLAIGVEAEAVDTSDERWVLTDPATVATPETSPDPDGNHSDGASGNAYLELLPDHRVTHDDTEFPPGTPGWFWGSGGQGPEMAWTIDFPEPGRYYVHARAYSTGSEDNGIHVGLDGDWPASGERIQWCAKNQWVWSSQQRGAPKEEHCGRGERTIWLDVPEAGERTVAFSAREDGFELDRFMLIKDLSGGTRLCLPTGADGIDCRNADLEAVDGFVDVGVTLEVERAAGEPASRRDVVATVANLDGEDAASVVTLKVALGDAWTLIDADERCEQEGEALACTVGDLAAGEETRVAIALEATRTGSLVLDATTSSNENDDDPANDGAGVEVTVEAEATASLSASLDLAADTVSVGDGIVASVVIANAGDADAEDIDIVLSMPEALEVGSVSDGCVNARPVTCSIDSVPAGESVTLDLTLVGVDPADSAALLLGASATDLGSVDAAATIEVVAAAPEGDVEGDVVGEGQGEDQDPVEAEDEADAPVRERVIDGAPAVSSGGGAAGIGLFAGLAVAAAARRRRTGPARR